MNLSVSDGGRSIQTFTIRVCLSVTLTARAMLEKEKGIVREISPLYVSLKFIIVLLRLRTILGEPLGSSEQHDSVLLCHVVEARSPLSL